MTYHDALAALADPTRRTVLERLREGPLPVVEIARGLPVSRPAVSQHLRVLRDAGLVSERAEGTRRYYAIDASGVGAARTYLDGLAPGDPASAGKPPAAAERTESAGTSRAADASPAGPATAHGAAAAEPAADAPTERRPSGKAKGKSKKGKHRGKSKGKGGAEG